MSQKSDPLSLEVRFAQILKLFNKKNKSDLAEQLVKSLGLVRHGDGYPNQVEKLLNRSLTSDEVFKLRVLDQLYNYEGGGGGNGEEEE